MSRVSVADVSCISHCKSESRQCSRIYALAAFNLLCFSLTTSCSIVTFSLQYGFNLVMSHAHAVNEIALSLNNKNSR